jgi:diguanylate cyclase (GGDEF)-like protein
MSEAPKTPTRVADSLRAVPGLPQAASAVMDCAWRRPDDAAEVARIIASDAALAARFAALAAAGSAGGAAASAAALVAEVRPQGAASMVLALALQDMLSPSRLRSLDLPRWWRHAVAVAAAARYVAQRTGCPSPDEAFAAGLVHDVGRAALDMTLPDDFARVVEAISSSAGPAVDEERRLLGIDHAGAGEFVLSAWRLPVQVSRAVGLHHHTSLGGVTDKPVAALAAALQAADFFAWSAGLGGLDTAATVSATLVVEKALKGLGAAKVFDEIAREVERWGPAFGISMPGAEDLRSALAQSVTDLARSRAQKSDADALFARREREAEAADLLRRRLRGASERDEVKGALLECLCRLFGFDRAAFFNVEDDAAPLAGFSVVTAASPRPTPLAVSVPRPDAQSIVGKTLASGRPAVVAAGAAGEDLLVSLQSSEAIVAPVAAGKRLSGVVVVDNYLSHKPLTEDDAASAAVLVDEVAQAFETLTLQEHAQRMKAMAETDSLTGLSNRRYLILLLGREVDRAKRYSMPLSLVMIDLEGFKLFNDRFGHQVGDAVLKSFGRLLRKSCRNIDIPGRLGGDEFLVILPETNLESAGIYVERLRKLLTVLNERLAARYAGSNLTMSVGLTSFNDASDNIDSFLHRADQAMYAAKQRGRNRVCAL